MTGCLLWTGRVSPAGYGYTYRHHAIQYAHRDAYAGIIPPGYVVHHLCGVKLCINPDHLQAIPKADHHRLHKPRLATCARGHLMAVTAMRSKHGRECRTCRNIRRRARRQEQAA